MAISATLLLAASDATDAVVEETNNPILPVGNELFYAAVCFLLLWVLMKYVLLPPVLRGMDARDEKVRSDLGSAEDASAAAEAELADYEASLVSTKVEALRTVEDARAQAEAARRAQLIEAESTAAATRTAAAEEISAAKRTAKDQAKAGLTGIVLGAAEAVVQGPVDRAGQTPVVEAYVNRSGSAG